MKKSFIGALSICAILFSGSVIAGKEKNPCGNSGNNCNVGGGGGAGGDGGAGGSVSSSGNSTNTNSQIQKQELHNYVKSTNANDNRSSATGGAVNNRSTNANDNRSSATGGAVNNNGNTQSNEGNNSSNSNSASGNSTSVTVQGDNFAAQERNPVATASAAPLTTSNGTCMGSSSAGAQVVGMGLSFGTTWTDSSCDLRYDAEALRASGFMKAAAARLCQKPEIAKAMEEAGTPCQKSKKTSSVESAPVIIEPNYTDTIVRKRLGLPAL